MSSAEDVFPAGEEEASKVLDEAAERASNSGSDSDSWALIDAEEVQEAASEEGAAALPPPTTTPTSAPTAAPISRVRPSLDSDSGDSIEVLDQEEEEEEGLPAAQAAEVVEVMSLHSQGKRRRTS